VLWPCPLPSPSSEVSQKDSLRFTGDRSRAHRGQHGARSELTSDFCRTAADPAGLALAGPLSTRGRALRSSTMRDVTESLCLGYGARRCCRSRRRWCERGCEQGAVNRCRLAFIPKRDLGSTTLGSVVGPGPQPRDLFGTRHRSHDLTAARRSRLPRPGVDRRVPTRAPRGRGHPCSPQPLSPSLTPKSRQKTRWWRKSRPSNSQPERMGAGACRSGGPDAGQDLNLRPPGYDRLDCVAAFRRTPPKRRLQTKFRPRSLHLGGTR
jgi:hypothetical protein